MNKSEQKVCQNCKNAFVIDVQDFDFYEKVKAPPPTWCLNCRMQRRLSHRNERTLYKRRCDLCKHDIVAIYPQKTSWPVYCAVCWWGDQWDAKSFALDYDPQRPFFDQFKDLQTRVPRIALLSIDSVKSEYTNNAEDNKNCYLIFAAGNNEDCAYARLMYDCRSVMDASYVYESELCYECIDCQKCYQCLFSERCQSSIDLLFCFDIRNSNHCILSSGLRNVSYSILNKQCSKEEYEKKKQEILASSDSLEAAKQQFEDLKSRAVVKYAFQTKCINATGDYLYNCQTSKTIFDTRNAKDCAYLADTEDPIDCWDGNNMYYKPELCLDIMGILQCYNAKYSTYVLYSSNIEYCDSSQNLDSCFGCIGIRKSKYCILNKEYSKESYEKFKDQIIKTMIEKGEYGSFFPSSLSPHGYNETLANDFYPLSKESAIQKSFWWQETVAGTYGKETITTEKMPQTIEEVPDNFVNEVFICRECSKNFRVTTEELQFYRRMRIPLPREDFECRLRARLKKRTPRKLWHRKCQCAGVESDNKIYQNTVAHFHKNDHCPNEFQTTYDPDRKEIVYCEACYQHEVI